MVTLWKLKVTLSTRHENMFGAIIIEHDEDADRHLIDMALSLSQQSETNNRNTTTNSLTTRQIQYKTWTPTFSIFPVSHVKILPPSTSAIINAVCVMLFFFRIS